jgi:hypothetical protein
MSQVSVSRIERGLKVPTLSEINAWADAVEAPAETRERLVQLTEAAHAEVVTWRVTLRDKDHLQNQVRELEDRTTTLRNFQPVIVPGLLQTAEYARRVFPLVDRTGRQDYAAAVAARMQRQEILYNPERRFEFLITEAALRWQPGPDPSVLIPQLDRVAQVATLENVRIGLIPHGPVTAIGWHPFVIYEDIEDGDPFVQVEMVHGMTTVDQPEDVAVYRSLADALGRDAVYDREAREMLDRIASDVRDAT